MDTLLSAGAFREHPWDLPRFSPPLGLCTWLSVPSSLPLPFCSVPRGFTQGASPHLSLSFPLSGSGGAPFWVLGHLLIPVAAASSFASSVHPSLPLAGSLDEYMPGLWGQTLMGSNPGPTQPL